jgi:hypothetical protein
MNENVVGVTVIRVDSSKYRWNEMAYGLRLVWIRNIDCPEAGIFPGAKNDISFYHSFDIVNAKPSPWPIRRTKPVQRQSKSGNLHWIFLVAHIKDVHVTERTLFRRGDLVGGDDNIGPAPVRRNHDTDAMCIPFLGRGPLNLADHRGFPDIADIQNDDTLVAVGEIRAVFVGCQVVQRDPDLRQSLTQTAVAAAREDFAAGWGSKSPCARCATLS